MSSEKLVSKILEKWPVKVISLAAALVIAVFYRMNTLDTRNFSVPVQIETNGFLVPTGSFIDTVRISLRGETNSIYQILEEDIEAFIDLHKYSKEGNYKVPVQIRKKGSSLGVEPLEINVLPIEIHISLEQKITRSIPVFPVYHGSIASGYVLKDQFLIPDSLPAEGPYSIITNLHGFLTEAIDINGRFEDFSMLTNIINVNPHITVLTDTMIEYNGIIEPVRRETQRPAPVQIQAETLQEKDEMPSGNETHDFHADEGDESQ